jgi:hypothetical protein
LTFIDLCWSAAEWSGSAVASLWRDKGVMAVQNEECRMGAIREFEEKFCWMHGVPTWGREVKLGENR